MEKLKNTEYDQLLGYRVIEALRNYVQHRGLPVHLIKFKASKVGELSKFIINPFLKVSELRKDGKFKVAVLDELENEDEKANLKLYIRQYVSSITTIHSAIRDILSEETRKWDNEFQYAYRLYSEKHGEIESLAIGQIYKGFRTNVIYIMKEPIQRRKWLIQKNVELKNLVSMFVSSEVTK